MSGKLISGLYKRIEQNKVEDNSKSRLENEFLSVVSGLVDFVKNDPYLTNEDIKLLALTDKEKSIYFNNIFNTFSDVVNEIKQNGAENIIRMCDMQTAFDKFALQLNDKIEDIYAKNKKCLRLELRNKYFYDYFMIEFTKSKKIGYTEYVNIHKSYSCSGTVAYRTTITIKEIAQIVGLVKFYEDTNLCEEMIREVVSHGKIYDFSVIEKILNHRSSIIKQLNQEAYGIYDLYKCYEHILSNEKDKSRNI